MTDESEDLKDRSSEYYLGVQDCALAVYAALGRKTGIEELSRELEVLVSTINSMRVYDFDSHFRQEERGASEDKIWKDRPLPML